METSASSRWRFFHIGLGLWLVATVLTWPVALTFFDETGYVGQARLLTEGRILPDAETPGAWADSPAGRVPRYPLFLPALLAPIVAVSPSLVFALGIFAAVGLACLAARVLDAWRGEPVWGLVVLIHPSITLLSRTVMVDLLLGLLALGAWWALHRERRAAAVVLFALLVAAKPTGIPLALVLVAVEGFERWRRPAVLASVAGCLIGGAATVGMNILATGSWTYGYKWAHLGTSTFGLEYLTTSGPIHARSLVLLPPLLIAGLWCLWKRRALAPALASLAMVGLMSLYFFVDHGLGMIDAVVSPRLIIPAVVFLLLGYADLAAQLARRIGFAAWMPWILMLLAPAAAISIGVVHRSQQAPAHEARLAAEAAVSLHGADLLGITHASMKAGVIAAAPIMLFGKGTSRPCVVLCNTGSESHRFPGNFDCEFPGYEETQRIDKYRVLVQASCAAPMNSPGPGG